MASYTLLEMVQSILSSIDGAEVTSISDDVEATQVASIIRDNYYWIVNKAKLPEHYSLFEITQSSSSTPTVMTIPSHVGELTWVKYDIQQDGDTTSNFQTIQYQELDTFLQIMHSLNTDDDNVDTFNLAITSPSSLGTFELKCYNDRGPSFYTTFDDHTILFDAYDSDVETFLKTAKTEAYGHIIPAFTLSDGFTPDLDDDQFQLLLLESKTQAFEEMKQTISRNAERKARSAWITSQANKQDVRSETWFNSLPNYGRRKRYSTVRF